MFFFFSKILDALLSPYTWGIGLMALSLPFRRGRGLARKRWRALPLLGFAILLVFSLDPVANRLTLAAEGDARKTQAPGQRYDAVILLGGVLEDRSMQRSHAPAYNGNVERLLVSFDLLRREEAAFVVISGSSPTAHPETVEAKVLADQLAGWGIARERIVLEDRSFNTRENALFTMAIVKERGWKSLLVVTSAMHMKRAMGCFRAIGAQADALPVDYRAYDPSVFAASFQPRVEYLSRSTEVLRELFGRTVYGARGWAVYE